MELQTESYVKAKGLILRGAKAAEAASRLIPWSRRAGNQREMQLGNEQMELCKVRVSGRIPR